MYVINLLIITENLTKNIFIMGVVEQSFEELSHPPAR